MARWCSKPVTPEAKGCQSLALRRQLLEGQPAPVADLDGVAAPSGGEQAQHVGLEDRGIHAEFERHAPAQPAADGVDELTQERGGLLVVVDVAGSILETQDVAGLRDVREQRVVAAIFRWCGLKPRKAQATVAPVRTTVPSTSSVSPRDVQPGHGVEHNVLVQPDQRTQRLLSKAPQPVAHGERRRHAGQAGRAPHERIADEVLQMLQSSRPDVGQRHEQQGEARAAVVPPRPAQAVCRRRGRSICRR